MDETTSREIADLLCDVVDGVGVAFEKVGVTFRAAFPCMEGFARASSAVQSLGEAMWRPYRFPPSPRVQMRVRKQLERALRAGYPPRVPMVPVRP